MGRPKKKKFGPKKRTPMTDFDMSPAQVAADSRFSASYHHALHDDRIKIIRTIRESLEKSPSGMIPKKEVNRIILDITKTEGDENEDENNQHSESEPDTI